KSLLIKVKASKGLIGEDLVQYVSCKEIYNWNENGLFKVAVLDCGTKYNILRLLEANNCQVSVFPACSKADQVLSYKPQGLLLSNGPGDPAALDYLIATVKKIIGKIPVFGICLGHQILGLALGAKTYKLKFGHHGGNHPVKDLKTGRIYITSQNHGFCVDAESLQGKGVELSHINLNDNTLEGFYHKGLGIFSVQFHPESSPGPQEANILFREFITMMERGHA
ncbi:MAG: carbamoyl phosphate synthase small subunit, partial [Candidatus Omnitrophica bacterium]|nr:carbamoyl phosphate synthase small subunit [Candidatus Omnitrophota bacterium]